MDRADDAPTSLKADGPGPTRSTELPIGTQVGPYVIVGTLGQGGMGQVFLGDDPRLHRKVALKRLLPSAPASEDDRARVLREARAAAQVNHPNVATVHDIIEHGPHAFIVMEYVEGESLAALLRRERLPIDRVIAIGRQLAAALVAAHARGVIHRDLKPANVQLTPNGTVKVLDFGVAGATAAFATMTGASAANETQVAQPGTRGYMSPEQMFNRHVDERSDIFSFGIVLFELATGERAFPDIDMLALVEALARPVRRADVVTPRVPRDLADLIAKALEIEPAKRFQSAGALAAALDDLPSAARGPSSVRATRSRPQIVLRAVGAVVAVFGIVVGLGQLIISVFNLTAGRTAPFGAEPLSKVIELGLRSLVTPALYITAMLIVFWVLRFTVRILRLSRRIDRWLILAGTRLRRLASGLDLTDPTVFAQAVATLGAIALVGIVWQFSDLLLACTTTISDAPAERLVPLRWDLRFAPALYRLALDALILALSAAVIRIRTLRARQPAVHRAGLVPIVSVLVLTVLLLEAPYRLLWNNDATRVDLAGERCYVLGEHDSRLLLFCPDRNPPRNQIVDVRDPTVVRLSDPPESIFTPPRSPR